MTETTSYNQAMQFHELNPEKGIINIGSHPENDIVIQDPQVMPFHLMLDLRGSPYHVIGLSPEADIRVDGAPLHDGEVKEVMDLSQVQFCGYSLNLRPANGGGTGGQIAVVPPQNPIAALPVEREIHRDGDAPAATASQPMIAAAPVKPVLQVPTSEVILVDLQEQKLSIDVEQTAVYPITIVNGGSIVASFEVQVEGVPAEWVKISPDRVNLNEGGRAAVNVHITPPRSPDSRAGDYPLLIKVGSSNYPGQFGGVRADLTVNPYYEFVVGNLSPRYKSVSWKKHSANTHFPITNQGNSPTNYLVMAQDDENGCQFEFQVQDDVSLVKQAEVAVQPAETRTIPIRITPQRRNLVRLRARQYQYAVTTQSMNDSAASRIVSGTFVSRPLFGLFHILLAVILLLAGAFFLFQPRINEFSVAEDVIALGEPAVFNWKVSPFTTSLRIEGVNEEITGSQNQIEVIPNDTAATYTLVAGNWLSRLLRMEDVRSKPITVLSIPPSPEITTFFVDKTQIFEGDDVTIKWSVSDAEEVFLTVDGVRGALKPEEFNGERTVTLRNNSLIVLESKNSSGSKFRSEFIHAQKPSIKIDEFSLSKTQITKGEPVTIKWKVSGVGVENVQISPFEEVYPLKGELTFFPEASMEFVLTIKNRDLEEIRLLPIGVLEPGAEPKPPTVEFFKVAPEEIVGSGTVELSWSVSGQFDRVEVTNLEGVVLEGLPAQGFKALNVEKTTSYVLTAYNGDLSSAAILEVKVNDTKKNVLVVIDKILPATSIFRGDSVTVYYTVTPATKDNKPVDITAQGWPELSGSVVVTDGYDTCAPVDLPVHACVLTLNTSEANKQIMATYSGDDNYVRRTSDPFPVGLDVVGASPKYTSYSYSTSPIVVGQQTQVSFEIAPEDPAATIPISGKVKVVEGDATLCIATLTAVVGDPLSAKGECLLDFTTAGNKFLTLKYEGNDIYDGKTASMPMLAVNPAGTQISLAANWATQTVVGEPLTVQVAVAPLAPGNGIPTGQFVVQDKNHPTDKCTGTLNSQGKGQCSLTLRHVGTLEIVGSYVGDDNFGLSNSGIYTHPVGMASTTTTLTAFTPATTVVGQEVVVNFRVRPVSPGSGNPTGSVTVDAGGGDTCTGTINAAGEGHCAVLLRQAGTRSLKGTYAGDSLYRTSEALGYSYPVTAAGTSTSIVSHSPSPSALNELVEVKFTVELSQPSVVKPSGSAIVVASTGETCNATVTDGAGSCNVLFATEGRRSISVRYLGGGNYAASISAAIDHVVKKATLTTILSVSPTPSTVDQPVNINFSVVAVTGGGDPPSGTVTVTASTGETCTGPLSGAMGSCPITFSTSGSKTLTATYNGDADFKTSTTAPYSITVSKATTTTEITTDLSTTTQVGEDVTVAFRVNSSISANATGSVTVSAVGSTDPRESCTSTLSAGTGSCTLTLIQAGVDRSIQAVYAGTSDRFTASTSAIKAHTVNPAATTVEILSDLPDPSVVGQLVTFQVRVRANTLATLRPGGSFVVRLADNTDLCSGVLNASSEGSCSYAFTSQGSRSIKAVYSGAADYAAGTSGVGTHNVDNANTVTTVSVSPSPSILNQPTGVTVTVAATGSGSGTPTGSVSVTATRAGSTNRTCTIADISSGSGSCNITLTAVGDWTVTAAYSGDSNFNGSSQNTTQTVNKVASATSLSVSPTPSVKGQSVTVNVSVAGTGAGSGALSGSVAVTATKSGSLSKTCTVADISSGSGSCSLTPDAVGDWTVSAVYSGNGDFEGSSNSITHPVDKIPTTTTVTAITPTPSVTGQSVVVSVEVTKSGAGSGTPDGNVLVTATRSGGGGASCSAAIVLGSGAGTCSLPLNAAGTWTISAAYQGSTNFQASSGTRTQIVNQADTTTTVTLSPTSSVTGQDVTVNVSVAASGSGSGTPSGTVNVTAAKDGGGSASCPAVIDLASGSGSCTLALPSAGDWTVSGTYSADTNFKASTGTKDITVGKATTSLSITGHTPAPSTVGSAVTVSFNLGVTAPGSGTPTGLVTVTATIKVSGTDYVETCSATGAAGTCNLTLSQAGTWALTAAYPGDTSFRSATSTNVNHIVY